MVGAPTATGWRCAGPPCLAPALPLRRRAPAVAALGRMAPGCARRRERNAWGPAFTSAPTAAGNSRECGGSSEPSTSSPQQRSDVDSDRPRTPVSRQPEQALEQALLQRTCAPHGRRRRCDARHKARSILRISAAPFSRSHRKSVTVMKRKGRCRISASTTRPAIGVHRSCRG